MGARHGKWQGPYASRTKRFGAMSLSGYRPDVVSQCDPVVREPLPVVCYGTPCWAHCSSPNRADSNWTSRIGSLRNLVQQKESGGLVAEIGGDFVHSLQRADACDSHLLAWTRALSSPPQSRGRLRNGGGTRLKIQGKVTATRHRSRQQSSGRATDREV